MGIKLMALYNSIKTEMGLKGQMLLAQKTKTPSTKAALEPDSAENIENFRKAYTEITGKPAPLV